jgi:hypothetical protein
VPTRAFDPEQPIVQPVRALLRLPTGVRADELLQAGEALDSLLPPHGKALVVDFETLGPKGGARAEMLSGLIERLRGRGLRLHGTFTLGHDHDDVECFDRLVEWVEAQKLMNVELRLWTPEPSSPVVRTLALADRILHRDWERWDGAHVVVSPAQMSAQTLYRGWAWARRRLGSLRSIWRRRPTGFAALPAYLLEMASFRHEPASSLPVMIRPTGPATLLG